MFNVDDVINNIVHYKTISESVVFHLLYKLQELLVRENNLLQLRSPIVICGDIHGQFDDLLKLFQISDGTRSGDGEEFCFTCEQRYLFLGDYVDRGLYSLNTFLLLCCLKLKCPDKIFMLRGNHESRKVSYTYGFFNEIIVNYGHPGIWNICNDVFDLLPMAAMVDNDVFCVHGGLSPDLSLISSISTQTRKVDIPEEGPFTDLCWSDPDDVDEFVKSSRGSGYLFGENQVEMFNRVNGLRFICRSHQLAQKGYQKYYGKLSYEPDFKLITVWSAPNYSYRSGNLASVLKLRFPDQEDPYLLRIFDQDKNYHQPSQEETPITSFYFA